MEKFWAGFQHCAAEVAQFLNKYDQQIGGELIQHISSYIPNIRPSSTATATAALKTTRLVATANYSTPRLAMNSRDLAAYNQRIFNKIPIAASTMNNEHLQQNLNAVESVLKKEFIEENCNVWRPW